MNGEKKQKSGEGSKKVKDNSLSHNGIHKRKKKYKNHDRDSRKKRKSKEKDNEQPEEVKTLHQEKPPSSPQPSHRTKVSQNTLMMDMNLLREINQRKHFTFRGKAIKLFNVHVNVANIKNLIPSSALSKKSPGSIRLELLKDAYKFSNVYRNIKCKSSWSTCIICKKKRLGLRKTTRWLDDPVTPPHLMVPIRWAQLSVGSPNNKVNFASEEGKVSNKLYYFVCYGK